MTLQRASVLMVTSVIGLLLMTSIVAATVTINTTAEYQGGQEGHDQAVEMAYTLTPDENTITNVRIQVQSTDNSFVDYDSFERTVNPGDAEVQINTVREGVYEINELEPNQKITLRFKAYPRTIKQEELEMAVVRVEYVQQGQSLSESTVITADLSDSPWFKYQDATGGGGSGLMFILLLLVGIGFGGGGTYFVLEYL